MDLLTYRFKRTLSEIDDEQRRQRQWWITGDAQDQPIVRAPLDIDERPHDVTQLLIIVLLAIAAVALLVLGVLMFSPGAPDAPASLAPIAPTTDLTQKVTL